MIVPNLAVDHVSPIALARLADVQAAIVDAPYAYQLAARNIGLTDREYADLRRALSDGDATYAPLPRHIDVMAGRRRNGAVYALHHVLVPPLTMGWTIPLSDGTIVYIPRVCGNLSLNRGHRITARAPHMFVNVSYRGYFQPVAFTATAVATPSSGPVGSSALSRDSAAPILTAPPAAGVKAGYFGWLAPLFIPLVSVWHHDVTAAPCSLGSNEQGVCRP
jgi:hypothetical protein